MLQFFLDSFDYHLFQLVTSKPIERKSILEEAAGISGIHARRQEAETRLNAAEGNL